MTTQAPTAGTAITRTRAVTARRRFRITPGGLLRVAIIFLWMLFVLLPVYWAAVMSIKPVSDYMSAPPVWFPDNPTTGHYTALGQVRGWLGLKNSLIIASAATIASVIIGTAAAYSMARFRTGGKHLAFWILSQRFMIPIAVVIPVFLLYRNVDLIDSHFGLVLLYTVFTLPFSVWMMYAYFRQMPVEIEEAALVDGCTRWQTLWRIVWPLAAPGIVSAGAFAFIFSWTEFLFAVILTSNKAVTLPVVISGFLGVQSGLLGEIGALTMISLVPALILGLLIQRHLVRGLTLGAVEG